MSFISVGTQEDALTAQMSEVDQMTLTQSSLARVVVTALHGFRRGREFLPTHPSTRLFSHFSPHIIQAANNGHSRSTFSRIAWVPR